jgi:hypothetical protein
MVSQKVLLSGYVFASVYGILNVVVYFDKTKLINEDSSMMHFVEVEDRLFRDKSFSIRQNPVLLQKYLWARIPSPGFTVILSVFCKKKIQLRMEGFVQET